MCGIAGSTDDPAGQAVRAMCATLRHRGPDDEGVHSDAPAGVTIGARRLSIMDIDGGHQPLCNEDETIWAAFNGEIYNHPALREDLRARGHVFTTGADTEVLVHLYEEYGESMVHALEGMFAFAIWDARERRLLLARDRFGEKPLFLHERDGELLFASEVSSLLDVAPALRELDPYALDAFFVFAYVPGPGTIVRGVRQLEPGRLLSWTRERGSRERTWWSPVEVDVRRREPPQELAAQVSALFEESVRTRMVADVPVGVFLSGGVDSTLVAVAAARASSRRLKTFTVGYDVGAVNETERARAVARALDADHHEVTLTQADVAERVPPLLARLDQPLGDRATVPLHALSQFARPRVTVALGGEGADELFGGYPRYRWLERARRVQAALPDRAIRSLAGALGRAGSGTPAARASARLGPGPMLERNLDWVTSERRHRRAELYGPGLAQLDRGRLLVDLAERAGELDGGAAARWLMHLDQVHYLPDDVLVKTDRASMLASLELRTVFLHRGLAELAGSLDTAVHLVGAGKALVHAMLPPGVLPASRFGRYRKRAFRVPAAEWLRGPLAPALREQLAHGTIYEADYFDRGVAARLAREHDAGTHDHSDRLWPLLALGLWADRFHGRRAH
ncbi:MAG TPA: asparagine synthase (glutamine-hydrolyzing) [Solirubrobacteraceae bacterium]|jgi:asparagine synthase (glutamine-hydrolysing)|nr:asparagine synthase (glutamine-hydrolyzing) [Solirubrobacteraceae bacterium]